MGGAVRRRRDAVRPAELVVNEPTLCSPTVKQMSATERSVPAQQRGGPLQPARQQVLVRCLAERAPELAAEVRGGEVRGPASAGTSSGSR